MNKSIFKNYTQFLILSQKNINLNIGINCDLNFISGIKNFTNLQGNNLTIHENNLLSQNSNIPIFYRTSIFIKNLKKINNLFILGSFPRYETSIINLYFRQIFYKYKTIIGNIGPYNNHTYNIKNFGTSSKSLINLFNGSSIYLKKLKNNKKLIITTGLNKYLNNFNINLNFYNKLLIEKFFFFFNNKNYFIILNSDLSSILLNEIDSLNNSRSINYFNNFKNFKKIIFDRNYFLNTINKKYSTKKTESIILTSHNILNLKNKSKRIILLPILTHFEKNSIIINIEGQIQKSVKVTSRFNTSIKNLNNIIESFYEFVDNIFLNYINKNNKFNSKNYIYNTIKQLKHSTILNIISINNNKYLFSFFYLYKLPKIFNLKLNMFIYKNHIKNFYQTDLISNNSTVMSLSTLFNVNNYVFPKKLI